MTSRSRHPDRWLSLIPDLDTLDPDHPYDYTENRFREEMGWPTRKSYS